MSFPRYLAAGVCGGLATWLGSLAVHTSTPTPDVAYREESEWRDLRTELANLRDAIDRLAQTAEPTSTHANGYAASPTRRETEEGLESESDLSLALAALADAIRTESAAIQDVVATSNGNGNAGLGAMVRMTDGLGDDSVRSLAMRAQSDKGLVDRELRFLSPREILAQFGRPRSIGADGSYWEWSFTGSDGMESELWVRFGNGYVTTGNAGFSAE